MWPLGLGQLNSIQIEEMRDLTPSRGWARVFVSHKREDAGPAGIAANQLWHNGIPCYIDFADPGVPDRKEDIGDHFRDRLRLCTHLLAVISDKTKASEWVPFEVGMATGMEYPLATYAVSRANIPDFLLKWPYLTSQQDLDTYAKTLASQQRSLARDFRELNLEDRQQYARGFHRILKQALGQPEENW